MTQVDLECHAQIELDRPAIIESPGRRCTRAHFIAASNRLAHALWKAGLRSGDAIAVLAPNCIEYLIIYRAAIISGFNLVPVNSNLAAPEVLHIIRDCKAATLIAHEQIAAPILEAVQADLRSPGIRIALGCIPGFIDLESFIAGMPEDPVADCPRGNVLRYTSATTGRPKAVRRRLTRGEIDGTAGVRMQAAMHVEPDSGNVHLCNSKLYHVPVLVLAMTELEMGHLVVLTVGSWDPEKMLRDVQQFRVTTTFMVPTMFVRLLKMPARVREQYDITSLRHVLHAAAPCPMEIKKAMIDWWGPIIWERYGSVEGPVTLASSEDWLRYPGTVGRAELGTQIRILDERGNTLPPGQAGEIFIRLRPGFDFEYQGDSAKTIANRCGDYYTVGDVGYLNEEGFLFLCDRKIDMIISGGVNIYSAEIEQTLILHPAIADCAVFGIPHEVFGEVPKAVVQPAAGVVAGPQLTADILEFLGRRLARMKVPKQLEYASHLPRDANGKIYKRLLRSP